MRKGIVMLSLFAAVLCSCSAATTTANAPSTAVAAVTSRFAEGIEAFNRHDVDAFTDQFADDVEMYTPTGWVRGRAEVRKRFVETFSQFPNVRMETEALRVRPVASDTVVIDFQWRVFPMGRGPAFHGLSSGVYVSRGGRWVEVLEHETVVRTDVPLPGSKPR